MIAAPDMHRNRSRAQAGVRRLLARVSLVAALLLAPSAVRAEVVNRILATVDGEPITLHEVREFLAQRLRGPARDSAAPDPAAALDPYLTEKLIQMEVRAQGIAVRDEDVDRYIEGIQAQNQITAERLREAVEAQGLSWEAYRTQVRHELEKAQLINREIRGKVNVTPEDVGRYYEAHKEDYATPGGMHLRHILLRLPAGASPADVAAATAQIEGLRKRIAAGEDFAALAKEYSEDAAADSGGDLGWLARGHMLDEIEAAAAALKVGEVSSPVRSAAGVHLIKLEGTRDPSHLPVGEQAEEIKQQLYNSALEERYQRWLTEDLRKRHHVEILM